MRLYKTILLLSAAFIFLSTFSACTSDNYENDDTAEQVLTLLVPHYYYRVVRQAERSMAQALYANGIVFRAEISQYNMYEEGMIDFHMRLRTMLMAGQAYDIFFWDYHPLRSYAYNGFLTDIYTLIDQHPTTSREDFFTNILEAYEFNGGLYAFPLTFGFEYIGVNAALPQSIVDSFKAYDFITLNEIFYLYMDLRREYGVDFSHLDLGNSGNLRDPFTAMLIAFGEYIDLDNRVSYLNTNSFVYFLEDISHIFGGRGLSVYIRTGAEPTPSYMEWAPEYYAFLNLSQSFSPLVAMFDMVEPDFLHFIPLTNDDGKLIVDPTMGRGRWPTWGVVCLPTAGNSELAWEFIQYLIPTILNPRDSSDSAQRNMMSSLTIPISRAHFRPHIERVLRGLNAYPRRDWLIPFVGIHDDSDWDEALENAVNRLEALSEMPAAIIEMDVMWPIVNNPGAVEQFILGLATAETTAQELHNIISLWLIE